MDLKKLLRRISPLDESSMDIAKKRQSALTKPTGSLGLLEDISIMIGGITKNPMPELRDKAIIVMASDHGVTEEGMSAYPKEVTAQMVLNFLSGGAAINVLARDVGARVTVVDMGIFEDISHKDLVNKKVSHGTSNIKKGPAMSYEKALESIEKGIEAFEDIGKIDIVGVGDMGIGNTTAASAIISVITEHSVREVTGRGTGISRSQLEEKISVIEHAIDINKPDRKDPIDVLAKIGGFEIGGITGVILSAASHRIPVVLDGLISSAGALIAYELQPGVKDYMIASHLSVEKGHRYALKYMGLKPLLDLRMRLGEGTGAALGIYLSQVACDLLRDMATFDEAGVSRRLQS